MNLCLVAAAALLVDRIVGDPAWLPHPVIWMGKWVRLVEQGLHRPVSQSAAQQRCFGGLLTLSTVGLSFGTTWLLLWLIHMVNPVAALIVNIWLTAATIAWKGLADAGSKVFTALMQAGIPEARQAVGEIVGRDTDQLPEAEVVRATVETLSENIVDAIVSPVLFACIGGAPLAMAYRASNTLDAMVGYKNQRYLNFGFASARLDDVLNYVPARVTSLLMWLTACLLRLRAVAAWQTMRREAHLHPSPNSGIPEAMLAGMLGIQLGGVNYYQGVAPQRATFGLAASPLGPKRIVQTICVLHATVWLLFLFVIVVGVSLWLYGVGWF